MQRERGFALPIVILTIAVATLLVVASSAALRSTGRMLDADVAEAQRAAMLEGAIATVVTRLIDPEPSRRWRSDGTWRPLPMSATDLLVHIQDANGLVDLNKADALLIKGLFTRLAGSAGSAMADRVLDRRGTAGKANGSPAVRTTSAAQQATSFQHFSQVRALPGMTATLFQALTLRTTLYNADGSINVLTAPREVLLSVPNVSARDVDQLLARRSARAGVRAATSELIKKAPAHLKTGQGPAFIITIGNADNGGRIVSSFQATVLIEAAANTVYRILDWSPDGATAMHGQELP